VRGCLLLVSGVHHIRGAFLSQIEKPVEPVPQELDLGFNSPSIRMKQDAQPRGMWLPRFSSSVQFHLPLSHATVDWLAA